MGSSRGWRGTGGGFYYLLRGVAGLLGALSASLLSLTPFLERWELQALDHRFAARGPRPTSARIVLATISDSTLAAWNEPMAFWGSRHAAVITRARELGAQWIGLDFIQGVSGGPEADQQFAAALHGGRVVLSQKRFSETGPINPIPALLFAHPEQPENLGFIDARPELDDAVRRAAVYSEEGGQFVPSFAALLALRLRRQSPTSREAYDALAGSASHTAGADSIWINYVGAPGAFPSIPVERLAEERLSDQERRQVRDAVVLIGPTYSGSNDQYRGLGGAYYAGVEINAHILATLLDDRPLRRASRGQEAAITAAVGILIALALGLAPGAWGLLLVVLAAGAWWWGAAQAFAGDRFWPTAGPFLAMGLTGAGHFTARSLEEARRRRQIQSLFGRYVTPEIVNYLLRHPSHLQLGGQEGEASILFLDIRGHTTAAQDRKPSEVMEELNALFCQITPVIQHHGGLLYGYRGDGFLAVFGAPCPQANHGQAAVDAAIEAVRIARRVSDARCRAGGGAVRIGCGIHSGRVVCGNLGAMERAEYTVIGDTVNVASRLEESNKSAELNPSSESSIVISQETYDRLECPPPVRGPFDLSLRGREGRVRVYTVLVGDE